jgi:hypothetical protein
MRTGRKRKSGKREKNGRIQRVRDEDQNQLAARMPHRASEVIYAEFIDGTAEIKRIVKSYIPLTELHSEKAENPLGRLRLVGAISEDQYLAGREFGKDLIRYRRIIDCKRDPQSIAGFAEPCAKMPSEPSADEATKCLTRYMLAFEAIGSRSSQLAVKHIIAQERDLAPGLFKYLVNGLTRLVKHYNLTT